MTRLFTWIGFLLAIWRSRDAIAKTTSTLLPVVAKEITTRRTWDFGPHKSPAWWDRSTWDERYPS